MKKSKKIIAIVLSIVMLLACTQVLVSASTLVNSEKDAVTIFVDGINSEAIVSARNGKNVFPPDAGSIVSAVFTALPSLLKGIVTDDFSSAETPLVNAVNSLFSPVACDENGKPSPETKFDWEYPDKEEILEELEDETLGAQIKFAFDWRLDMKTIASQLHDFIEYVMDIAGVKHVNLIGFSMGTCAVMSYLKLYDYEYVNSVVLLSGAYNGATIGGEAFSNHINLDSDAVVRFVDAMLGFDMTGVLVKSLLHSLNTMGVLDRVCDVGNSLTRQLSGAVYDKVFKGTFATMPGMWALIPASLYDEAMSILGGDLSSTTLEMIKWYHDEVQANNREIIDGCFERGINFGIIAKYGYTGIPVTETINIGDYMIDTEYESFGATCADVAATLGENYTQAVDVGFNCVSSDNIIDASTCAYPEYTWFIKNSDHAGNYKASMSVCYSIINAPGQITVNNGEYPQFLVCIDESTVLPLTPETDTGSRYDFDMSGETSFSVFFRMIKNILTVWKNMISGVFSGGKVC